MFTYLRTEIDADDVGLLPLFSPAAEAKGLQSTRARIEPGTWAEMPGPRPGPKPGPKKGPKPYGREVVAQIHDWAWIATDTQIYGAPLCSCRYSASR